MLLLIWVGLGFFIGIIASQIPGRSRAEIVPNVSVSISGAVIGGWLFGLWAPQGPAGDSLLASVLPAGVGAILFLIVYGAVGRRLGEAHP